jgi:alanine racemase
MSDRPRAIISPRAIARNWSRLSAHANGAQVGAVVKADAYGHGLAPVGTALAAAGCRSFFVAYAFEGALLRQVLGPQARIHVFNGPSRDSIPEFRDHALVPVINSVSGAQLWAQAGQGGDYALHIDTGMNRLGLRPDTLAELAGLLETPCLIMSHYACADEPAHPLNRAQLDAFSAAAGMFPGVPTSLANTAGHFLGREFLGDVTRPGIGLYGGGTSPAQSLDFEPGLTLEAPILTVCDVPAGESVGYGATRQLDRPTRLATIALGYGDGFLRSGGNRGFAMLGDIRCAIMGRVSMDLITLDVSMAAGLAKPGAWVEMLGSGARLEAQAALAGTLGYELVTGLGPRIERTLAD